MPRGRPARRKDDRPRNGYGDDRGRGHGGYRQPSPPRYAPSRDRQYSESDSWRPGSDRRHDSHRTYHDDYRGADSYRPRPPQGEFTFRVDKPAGIANYAPGSRLNERRPPRRGGHNNRGGRPRWQPVHASERALIAGVATNLPEEILLNRDAVAKYRDLDQLSDDDELDMDIESHSSQSDTEGPHKKRARTDIKDESASAVPKWSNPDPYTALPCPDETTRKKRDVVKLIRKARLEDTTSKPAATEAEDFLAFDISDDDDDDDEDQQVVPAPPTEAAPPLPPGPPPSLLQESESRKESIIPSLPVLPTKPAAAQDHSGPLGSRKRTFDDEIKPPDYGQLKKVSMKPAKGSLVALWQVKPDEKPTPYIVGGHQITKCMATRLHKEICDWYDFVKPRDYEQTIRTNLVVNLTKAMQRDGPNFATAKVFSFGSFKSGLYLPTADMDLVVCSEGFLRGGQPLYLRAKNWLYKFRRFLTSQRVADYDSIEVIAHARVPLVKYVDRVTGLKVDISFENLGGVDAVSTFEQWKTEYPAMPILVTLIKHFLLMRGLNEPVNGGIGGFSVICLVVSMFQMMPHTQSRAVAPEHNLGEMLIEFLNLYGRHFRYDVNAISLTEPVGYIRKSQVTTFSYKNTDRLSIIDPNNPSNDISGGSSNTTAILARFQEASEALYNRMHHVSKDAKLGGILDVIMQGDYSSFRKQRAYLKRVHEQTVGPCSD